MHLILILWNVKEKHLKSKQKLGFHFLRHSVSQFFCQHGLWSILSCFTSMIRGHSITCWVRNVFLGKWLLLQAFWPITHTNQRTDSALLWWFAVSSDALSHCAESWHYLCNLNSRVVNTKPKLRLQNDVGAKFLCQKCVKNLKLRKPK
jgi:hypothetical protein